jgi:dipeptidyl aminopeptidase/acylaminoacyl peptidase
MRRLLLLAVAVSVSGAADRGVSAQAPSPFTAEDMLDVATANVLDFSEDGSRVAVAVRTLRDNAVTDHRRFGDPTYPPPSRVDLRVIDTRSGETDRPFKQLMNVRQASWSRDAAKLAILTAGESGPGRTVTSLWVWDPARKQLAEVPRRATIAVTSDLIWLPDGSRLVVALRDEADDRVARESFNRLVDGPIVVHSSSERFLDWDALRRTDRLRTIAEVDPATGEATTLVAKARITDYQLTRDGAALTFREDATEKTDYDVIGGTHNHLKRVTRKSAGAAVTVVDAKALKTFTPRWSDDGRMLAWAEKGQVFIQGIDDSSPRALTPPVEGESGESFSVSAFSRDASRLLVTSKKGWSVASIASGARDRVLELNEKEEERNPRLSLIGWTPDGDGLIIQYGEPDRWDRGVRRLDLQSRKLEPLVNGPDLYQNIRYSRDGRTVVFQRSNGDRPTDLYVAQADFTQPRRLLALNPWIERRSLPASELVTYRDADGKVLHGILRYPVGYQKDRRYPTVFEIYETFFDNGFNARAALLANRGYAVFHPSVNLVVGRPAQSWSKGVTAAANRLIDMGIADPDRLGVHGTSYGGYATVLLLTETDRFKAAINISGKVNMVSFYTDSPRLGVRNTHAPEKSQDRIGGTLWEFPERYLEHSAIMRADRIRTPLLNITGDQDPNVPASQSREIYYALRRLGRDVEWVRYVNGGHRPPNSAAESVDFENRIVGWYDKYLKPPGAPSTTQER